MKLLGNNYRLFIETAVAGTYAEIKGQQGLKVNRQSAMIDTSSKDDGAYGTQAPGQKAVSIDFDLKPNLPDANGFTRLETRALASPQEPTMFQIRKGGSGGVDPGDVVFQASMYIGNFDADFPPNGVVTASGQLALAEPPEVDTLA